MIAVDVMDSVLHLLPFICIVSEFEIEHVILLDPRALFVRSDSSLEVWFHLLDFILALGSAFLRDFPPSLSQGRSSSSA